MLGRSVTPHILQRISLCSDCASYLEKLLAGDKSVIVDFNVCFNHCEHGMSFGLQYTQRDVSAVFVQQIEGRARKLLIVHRSCLKRN
jgi:hypothetical protein